MPENQNATGLHPRRQPSAGPGGNQSGREAAVAVYRRRLWFRQINVGPRNHVVWQPRAVGTDGCMVMKLRVDLQLRQSQRLELTRVHIGIVKRRRLSRCGTMKQYVPYAPL